MPISVTTPPIASFQPQSRSVTILGGPGFLWAMHADYWIRRIEDLKQIASRFVAIDHRDREISMCIGHHEYTTVFEQLEEKQERDLGKRWNDVQRAGLLHAVEPDCRHDLDGDLGAWLGVILPLTANDIGHAYTKATCFTSTLNAVFQQIEGCDLRIDGDSRGGGRRCYGTTLDSQSGIQFFVRSPVTHINDAPGQLRLRGI